MSYKGRGFTLVEMAVVVVIAGILLVMGLQTAMGSLASTQRTATEATLSNIKNALLAYYSANHRFPCPDTGPAAGRDGVEDTTAAGGCAAGGGIATSGMGTVPYVTLGLSQAQVLDAYGNLITYRVDTSVVGAATLPVWVSAGGNGYLQGTFVKWPAAGGLPYRAKKNGATNVDPLSDAGSFWSAPYAAGNAYSVGDYVLSGGILYMAIAPSGGALPAVAPPAASTWVSGMPSWVGASGGGCGVNNSGALSVFSSAVAPALTTKAVIVLISHGQNGAGAWLPNGPATARNAVPPAGSPELGNTVAAPTAPTGYRAYPPSSVSGSAFDDIVTYIDSAPAKPTSESTGIVKTFTETAGRSTICQ